MGLMVEVEEGLVELDIRALWCCCFMPGWKAPPYGHGFVSGDIVVQKQERKYLKRLAPSWKQNIVMMNFVLIEQAVLRWRADIYSLTTQGFLPASLICTSAVFLFFVFFCVGIMEEFPHILGKSWNEEVVQKWGLIVGTFCLVMLLQIWCSKSKTLMNCWKTQRRDRWVLPGYLVSPNCRFVWVWE